jgi:hypothetical protein
MAQARFFLLVLAFVTIQIMHVVLDRSRRGIMISTPSSELCREAAKLQQRYEEIVAAGHWPTDAQGDHFDGLWATCIRRMYLRAPGGSGSELELLQNCKSRAHRMLDGFWEDTDRSRNVDGIPVRQSTYTLVPWLLQAVMAGMRQQIDGLAFMAIKLEEQEQDSLHLRGSIDGAAPSSEPVTATESLAVKPATSRALQEPPASPKQPMMRKLVGGNDDDSTDADMDQFLEALDGVIEAFAGMSNDTSLSLFADAWNHPPPATDASPGVPGSYGSDELQDASIDEVVTDVSARSDPDPMLAPPASQVQLQAKTLTEEASSSAQAKASLEAETKAESAWEFVSFPAEGPSTSTSGASLTLIDSAALDELVAAVPHGPFIDYSNYGLPEPEEVEDASNAPFNDMAWQDILRHLIMTKEGDT